MADAPVIPITLTSIGLYLAWFGIHYWRRDVRWPTDPIKSVLQGKGLPDPGATPQSHQEQLTKEVESASAAEGATGNEQQASATGQPAATGGKGGGTPAQNIALGQMLASTYGWGSGNDWLCLKSGWQEESGWSTTAANVPSDPYNHAYGIPQANPGTKMATVAADWKTNPATQITWGLIYIQQTYGAPSKVPHWSPSGPTAGYVGY